MFTAKEAAEISARLERGRQADEVRQQNTIMEADFPELLASIKKAAEKGHSGIPFPRKFAFERAYKTLRSLGFGISGGQYGSSITWRL